MHRRIATALEEKSQNAQKSMAKYLNGRPRFSTAEVVSATPEDIAMFMVEANAEHRAYVDAAKIVTDIYRQIVQPQQTTAEELDPKKPKRIYG